MTKVLSILLLVIIANCQGPRQSKDSDQLAHSDGYGNHLVGESSPYLLQHAHNPVDWYPWGDEAMEKAKKENKLLVISVGYAACHWCHVMENESFADSSVAAIMNENYVSIKVDREERPDVDKIYMDASYLMTGRGGWPLNVIALPDGRPVFAGSYFPKKDWTKILNHIINQYEEDPERLQTIADQVTQGLQDIETVTLNTEAEDFTKEQLQQLHVRFMQDIDTIKGGRTGVQKFPTPSIWQYLMRYYFFDKDPQALDAVNKTLTAMAKGGIYDHLGGGFARYSTDPDWRVPHFEKMLYDNAQLLSLYARAYQLTKNPLYKTVVTETADFVKREMTSKQGAFYSSYDADSEGEEGKFYVWTEEEVRGILKEEADPFIAYYTIQKGGNWEHSKNILIPSKYPEKIISKSGLDPQRFKTSIENSRSKLFEARMERVPPKLDDKVLTSWNALMSVGYLDAYRVFGEKEYLDVALKNIQFLLEHSKSTDGGLNRNFKDNTSNINGFLDDYSHTIQALLGLYEATFDEKWLQEARSLTDYTIEHFQDPESGMFFYTSKDDPKLLARKMELSDNVIPGSNSSMANNLYLLGTYLYHQPYLDISRQMLLNVQSTLMEQPVFYSNWAMLMHQMTQPLYEVAIMGDNWESRLKEFDTYYLPNVIYLGGPSEGTLDLLENKLVAGRTTIYVCENKSCRLPVTKTNQALTQMDQQLLKGIVGN